MCRSLFGAEAFADVWNAGAELVFQGLGGELAADGVVAIEGGALIGGGQQRAGAARGAQGQGRPSEG